ncbi:MAG TPA: hypothetical protein VI585_26920 [Candidatus Binatia bacterium]
MLQASNSEKLDEHLLEVVRALHGAVKKGVSHSNDSTVIDNAITDCKEILEVIMDGNVSEWLN